MKKNIIANFIGRFWSVLSNFIFIPLYISFLGLESYSIISFTFVINGILALMDGGLTSTLSREFASNQNSWQEKIKTFRTLETFYFLILIFAISIIIFGSNFVAYEWLNLENISPKEVSIYIKIIGVEVGFRLIGRFYLGAFIGLEKQVKANIYEISWGVLRNGLVLIPLFFTHSLKVFFIWQTISTILYVLVIKLDIGKVLYKNITSIFKKPIIEIKVLKNIWKFAGGMMLISIVAGLNGQMDKIALSKLLSIEALGLYTLAYALTNGLNMVSSPVTTAILPRMTALFTGGKNNEALVLFNKSFILLSIFIFSLAASMMFFSKELLWVWTNNMDLAERAHVNVFWLAIGMAFLGISNLPFNVAIANGYTRYNNLLGIVSLVITMPGYWILTKLYEGVGAAFTFSFVQVIITVVFLYLVNRRFLKLTLKKLYINNIIVPITISFTVTFFLSNIIDIGNFNRPVTLILIGGIIFVSLFINMALLVGMKDIRKELFNLKL